MPSAEKTIKVYQELADCYDRQGQAPMRDRFLVLAADSALAAGQVEEAERVRARLLKLNPHHLIKPFPTFAEAMKSTDVQSYIAGLRRTYPYEAASHLLETTRSTAGGKKSPPAGPTVQPSALSSPDSPKVFKLQGGKGEGDPKPPRPENKPQPIPAAQPTAKPGGSHSPREAAASSPNRPGGILPFRGDSRPLALPESGPEADEGEAPTGSWVCTALFVLVLISGLALAFYTIARPFLAV